VNLRLLAPRLLLEALDAHSDADAWRAERARLDELAAEALPPVVRRRVDTPYLLGGDAGARIGYEGPPPFEHVFEYLEGAAQGWSHDDPIGPYEAAAAARPEPALSAYLDALAELCRRWELLRRPHGALIAYAHIHTAAADGDAAAGQRALDGLADTSTAAPEERAAASRGAAERVG
jgi:hypothetical protein